MNSHSKNMLTGLAALLGVAFLKSHQHKKSGSGAFFNRPTGKVPRKGDDEYAQEQDDAVFSFWEDPKTHETDFWLEGEYGVDKALKAQGRARRRIDRFKELGVPAATLTAAENAYDTKKAERQQAEENRKNFVEIYPEYDIDTYFDKFMERPYPGDGDQRYHNANKKEFDEWLEGITSKFPNMSDQFDGTPSSSGTGTFGATNPKGDPAIGATFTGASSTTTSFGGLKTGYTPTAIPESFKGTTSKSSGFGATFGRPKIGPTY